MFDSSRQPSFFDIEPQLDKIHHLNDWTETCKILDWNVKSGQEHVSSDDTEASEIGEPSKNVADSL